VRPTQGKDLVLYAETTTFAGADVVMSYGLGQSLEALESQRHEKRNRKDETSYRDLVLAYLESCPGRTASQQAVMETVRGKDERKLQAIREMLSDGMIVAAGMPKTLTLVTGPALELYRLGG
jgi:hypothetical protein